MGKLLKNGKAKNCGCEKYIKPYEDLSNKRFGKLIVKEMAYKKAANGQSKIYWKCLCDCGNMHFAEGGNLKSGSVQSCGCSRLENFNTIKHRLSGSRLNKIWRGMKTRCYNHNSDQYKHYGGKGVQIYAEWLDKENGFINFYDWANKNGYQENLTIDRIDVNGNYEPNNCRWVDNYVQMNNMTSNVYIKIGDFILTMADLCRKFYLNYTEFQYHIRVKKEDIKKYMLLKGCDVGEMSIQIL